MMAATPEQLRFHAERSREAGNHATALFCDDAANEIERLTKELKRAKSVSNAAWSEGHRQGMLSAGAVI